MKEFRSSYFSNISEFFFYINSKNHALLSVAFTSQNVPITEVRSPFARFSPPWWRFPNLQLSLLLENSSYCWRKETTQVRWTRDQRLCDVSFGEQHGPPHYISQEHSLWSQQVTWTQVRTPATFMIKFMKTSLLKLC